jgi:hypothetical protein
MSAARIKQIDKEKNALLKKVDPLIAKKKKLYSNMDITSAKSPEEKQLDKEISDLFSKMNALILEKRKLINFGTMPIKKKTTAAKKPVLGPKAKLMKLAVTTLRNKAKKLGISDVSKRTKENLVQSIILGEARQKRGTTAGKKATAKRKASTTRQTGASNAAKDRARKAEPPGRRISKAGNVYYERRKNRSDKPGQLAGEKYNGWTNYWTWKWNLELIDGNFIREMIEEGNYTNIYDLSQYLKEEATELLSIESPAGWIDGFMTAVLSEIDWYEIAENVADGTNLEK